MQDKTLKDKMLDGFDLPIFHSKEDHIADPLILDEVAERMHNNYPYHHPLYAGQMLKPPHPIAREAYALAMHLNPNNHALDGSRESSQMEKDAVAEIARMIGFESHLGHLTGGGTMANIEALWVSSKIHPGKEIVASSQAHYTHSRLTEVLQVPFSSIPSDIYGRMNIEELERKLKEGNVGTVVVTMGTTAVGAVDPLVDILELQKKYEFRIHADAAYGGYYALTSLLPSKTLLHFDSLNKVDSVVIDPHKHGLQPYGCGCIVFKDPSVGRYYKHDSPYTYFSSTDLHLGEISLECSRPGAAAVALWATMKQFPLVKGGVFASKLEKCHKAAKQLYRYIEKSGKFLMFLPPELDIVIWAPKGPSLSEISESSQLIFDACAEQDLHLALYKFPVEMLGSNWGDVIKDQDHVVCLRSTLMKWEHFDWVDAIFRIIDDVSV